MGDEAADLVLVVEIDIAPQKLALFQALLQGETGLAVIRCFDPEKRRQQLWTTPPQRPALYDWLHSLPESLQPEVKGEWTVGEQAV